MSLCEFSPHYRSNFKNVFHAVHDLNEELSWAKSYRQMKLKKIATEIKPKTWTSEPFRNCHNLEKKRKDKLKKNRFPKLTLLERSILPQDKYMEYLSTPNLKNFTGSASPSIKKKRSKIDRCSPRITQLSLPNKVRVHANWKCLQDRLPTEMLMRFQEILHTNYNLVPRDAINYYSYLDKARKKKLLVIKHRRNKLHKKQNLKDQQWIKEEIKKTIEAIVDFVKEQPLLFMNYEQILISDSLLNQIGEKKLQGVSKRNTNKPFERTILDIADKITQWIDTNMAFVDTQPLESRESVSPTISIENEQYEQDQSESTTDTVPEEYEKFNTDLLEKLIKILSNSSDHFLNRQFGEPFCSVSNKDILSALIKLKDQLSQNIEDQHLIENILCSWAIRNNPDEVDENLKLKIKEIATLIEWQIPIHCRCI